ncbi:MAG: hybrid sensor histidine kinase/response regulator, partial [Planctomycetota bacterium]
IDDLLDATRISRGKVRLRKNSVDLIDVVEASVTTVEGLAKAKAQSIQIVATGGDMRVFGDRVRLEQMATNLLNNAVKYSDQETSIRIILEQLSRKRVRISVADQGMGLPKESLERIFEPFTQRDVSSDGLGIGLSLVRQLASLHGGRVYAESPGPGLGSTFSIELPSEAYAESEEPNAAEAESESPVADTDVLLINSSGVVDGETAEALRGHGCRILAARETDFEAKAEDLRPQIVILTVKDLEGESDLLANKIRKLPSCHGATVIALRHAFQSQDPKRALERVAFDEIWTEPVPEESMIEAVNRCVSQRARAHHNETLLLVEDNEDSARGMCLLLREDESRHVVSASTVADALKAFEKYRPQVVLSDIGLPDGSGYDLAKKLRSHGDSRLLMIAISGHAGDVDRRRSLDAGFDEHLAKPVDFNKLRELLKGRVH